MNFFETLYMIKLKKILIGVRQMKRLIYILIIFVIVVSGNIVFAQNYNSQQIRCIACSDSGLYTAVGDVGIITSEDGISWSKVYAGTLEKINGIIWAMGKFVAVGDKGVILTSSNGKDWTNVDLLKDKVDLHSVASSGKEIIATGDNGTVLVSKDGVHWEQRRMATAERINRVRWINDSYIAVGGAMLILTSKDGITWEEVKAEPTFTIMFTDVAWNGEKYLVVGDHLNIWVSKDGKTWIQEESILNKEGMDYTRCIYSVVWTGDKFVAVGHGGDILSSTDGSDWHKEAYVTRRVLSDIIYSNGKFVVVGEEGIILTSEDGVNWNNNNSISAQSTNVNLNSGELKSLEITLNRPYGEKEDITDKTIFEVIDGADILSVGKEGTMKVFGEGKALVKATYDYKSIEVSVNVENDSVTQGEKNNQNQDPAKEDDNQVKDTKLSDIMLVVASIMAVIALTLGLIKKRKG